jgi:flagellar biosynthesis component FlhA
VKIRQKPTIHNLVDLSEKWNIKLEFSLGNLINVKKILLKHNVSIKEFISFLSFMIEHSASYEHIFNMVLEEINKLKDEEQLHIISSLAKSKENIFNVLKTHDAFKNRKVNLIMNEEENGKQEESSQDTITEENSWSKEEEQLKKHLELLRKYGFEEDAE